MGDITKPPKKPYTPWTADTERAFLLALGMCGKVKKAAREIGRSPGSAYQRRGRNPDFAKAWDAAIARQQAEWVAACRAAGDPVDDGAGGGRLAVGHERKDGWSSRKRGLFLRTLKRTKRVDEACAAAGVAPASAYALKGRSPRFAAAWEKALAFELPSVLEIAYARAVNGHEVPIVRGGEVVGTARRVSDTLLRELLRAEVSASVRREGEVLRKVRLDEEAERKQPEWRRARTMDEVQDSILNKLEAIERMRIEREAEAGADDWMRWRMGWAGMGNGTETMPGH